MPVDVAMEEPGSRIVSSESNDTSAALDCDDVSAGRVNIVWRPIIALNDMERVSVEVEWMVMAISRAMNVQFNDFIMIENEGVLRRREVAWYSGTTQNLQQRRKAWRLIRDPVDKPLCSVIIRTRELKVYDPVGGCAASWWAFTKSSELKLFDHVVCTLICLGCGFGVRCSVIMENGEIVPKVEIIVVARMLEVHWSSDPVILDSLVGIQNHGDPLSDVDVESTDSFWDMGNAIELDDGQRVTFNGKFVACVGRNVDDPETVSFALRDIDPGALYGWPVLVSAASVDCSRVRNWLVASCQERGFNCGSEVVVPIPELDHCVCIVYVVQGFVGVIRIIDDDCASKAINILRRKVTVVPMGSRLPPQWNIVRIAMSRSNRTLCDHSRSVFRSGSSLEETMPVNGRASSHVRVRQLVVDSDVDDIIL